MADTKITALPVITGAETAANDLWPMADISAPQTKNITRDELAAALVLSGLATQAYAAAAGQVSWSVVTVDQSITGPDSGYLANAGGLVTLTLPVTSAVGDTTQVVAHSAGGWKVAQNAGQKIYLGDTSTTVSAGFIASTVIGDAVELVCVVADTDWRVVDSQGNITFT